MALREIARFTDVYEADLAAAFLESHGIQVTVTDRFQTTVDPLMQRALGIRLMAHASEIETARDLLARVRAGEFADASYDDLPKASPAVRTTGTLMALATFATGGFWGTSLPRRFRPLAWQGMAFSLTAVVLGVALLWIAAKLILDPP
ncbi:hypothetical protein IP78_00745 [Brevundimonas sp. AAP58]|uniref:putative signal transducing protein n=1 Tax=Brevundimonas sp. AAP58 TaxID=1523422 RepID=UPI0006B92354|nr:DUF2007 domain-containing protein [Brevundimonas sp. AAP58]KPF84876.1 hypothetical protein IP78_00745 [Brevundimonas sp. AAP58]